MTKLYKATDSVDNSFCVFLVSDRGVAVSMHCGNDKYEIEANKEAEDIFCYDSIDRFEDAIDPVLIASW